MKNELFIENRNKIILLAVATAVFALALICFFGLRSTFTASNDKTVEAAVAKLTYTQDAAEGELQQLESLTGLAPLSDQASGDLYCALTEISYMASEDLPYNSYVAFALYYLNRANDTDSYIYLVNKYIGRLYANGCYQAASKVLDDVATIADIGTLATDIQAGYYLSYADVDEMLGHDPQEHFASAQEAIGHMPQGGAKDLNQAKYDILHARRCINEGDFPQAASIMSAYSETDDFGFGAGQVYVVCDFQIPYFEMAAKLALAQHDYTAAYEYTDKYIAACDYYDFRAMKLHLLQYVVDTLTKDGVQSSNAASYREMEHQVAQANLDEMTDAYGHFLLTDVDATVGYLADAESHSQRLIRDISIIAVVAYLLILMYCLGSMLIDHISKDGLTRLNNRRKYERAKAACARKKTPHCLLMIDIDDFKAINDTFGHERGDEVLRAIADILQRYSGRGINAYRYGGEELCMVLCHVSEQRTREIAEEIRASVENTVSTPDMRVTISGGVGVSLDGSSALHEADCQLYAAKTSGKNRIC